MPSPPNGAAAYRRPAHRLRYELICPRSLSRRGESMAGDGEGTLGEVMVSVWRQTLADGRAEVEVGGRRYPVGRTRNQRLRVVGFAYREALVEGIEQSPETNSRWAKLAREGRRIMQFSSRGRYIANVCDGRLTRYPAWRSQGLPE